jgi:hypothetical protein
MQLPFAGFSIRKEFLYGFLEASPFQRRRCRTVADGYFDPEVTTLKRSIADNVDWQPRWQALGHS